MPKKRITRTTPKAEKKIITKGIVFSNESYASCAVVFGINCCVYKMSGFKSFTTAKLARLDLLIIFKPREAIDEINALRDSTDPLITPALRNMLPILLQEAQGTMPLRVAAKQSILAPVFDNTNNLRPKNIKEAPALFKQADDAATQSDINVLSLSVFAPILFSTPLPSLPPQHAELTLLEETREETAQTSSLFLEDDDLTSAPDRLLMLSRCSISSFLNFATQSPALIADEEPAAKRVRLTE